MKTKTIISALLGILVLIILGITSCEKVPIVVNPGAIYTITVVNDSNGTITPSGVMKVLEAHSRTFTIKPNPGYLKDSLLVNGAKVAYEDSTFTIENIQKDYEIKPVFVKDPSFPWLLVNQYWKESIRLGKVGDKWFNYNTADWISYYSQDGTIQTFDSSGKILGEHKWDYEKTSPITLHIGRSRDFPEGSISYIVRLDSVLVIENKERDIRVTLEKVGKP